MTIFYAVILGLLGAILGSFAGALTWRIHEKKNFTTDRSECEKCHHKLGPLDLVPVISFLALRGKCRYCGKKIGAEKLVVELVGAAAFVLSYLFFPFGRENVVFFTTLLALWYLILTGLLILALSDAKYKILPNKIMYPTMVLALGFAALKIFLSGGGAGAILPAVGGFLLALLPITGVYLFIYLIGAVRGTELIGFGDIKLGVVFALLASWSANILVLFIANVVGALVAVVLMIMKKKKLASVVAFGPFLIVAFVVVFLGNFSLLNFAPLML